MAKTRKIVGDPSEWDKIDSLQVAVGKKKHVIKEEKCGCRRLVDRGNDNHLTSEVT